MGDNGWDVIGAKQAVEQVEQGPERMSRQRLRPRFEIQAKVDRYDAQFSRHFHNALHQVAATQTKRWGGAAPLARLDVDGLVGS